MSAQMETCIMSSQNKLHKYTTESGEPLASIFLKTQSSKYRERGRRLLRQLFQCISHSTQSYSLLGIILVYVLDIWCSSPNLVPS